MRAAERQLLERLNQIRWRADASGARTDSHVALTAEWLRRMALWARALDCAGDWPYFDVAEKIAPSVRATDEALRAMSEIAEQNRLRVAMAGPCEAALHWAALEEVGTVRPVLPAPYEPVIRAFERGASLTTHHGELQIGIRTVPRRTLDAYASKTALALDDESLDRIDEEARVRRAR